MSDDIAYPQGGGGTGVGAVSSSSVDPALTVRREFNFGAASRLPSLTGSDDFGGVGSGWRSPSLEDSPIAEETDEEQKEVQGSIFPCACAFHYKTTIVDQLVLLPLNHVTESLLFTPKNSVTCAPRAFIRILKELKAEGNNQKFKFLFRYN